MKPPQQPHPIHARQILQRLLVPTARKQFEHVALLIRGRGLMPGLKLHPLPGAKVPDGLKRERWLQAPKQAGSGFERLQRSSPRVNRDATAVGPVAMGSDR
jgi:hypothetical protein